MQQDAGVLYGPWRAEMARTDSSDRDQISFAHTTARLRLQLRLLRGCYTPVKQSSGVSRGKQLCHWYIGNASGVANMHRTNFEKRTKEFESPQPRARLRGVVRG